MSPPGDTPWSVEFYCTDDGASPVVVYMESLQKAERAALVRVLDLLAAFGPRLQMPHARHIEGDMWELRAASGRLFYFCYIERRFIVLHGYRKKTRQAPRREINTALRRLDDFVRRERNAR